MLELMNLMEKQVNKSDFYSSFDATILVAFFCFQEWGESIFSVCLRIGYGVFS